jgi:hypothetical protein
MPSIRLISTTGLACLGLSHIASAAANVEVRLLSGVCAEFAGAVQSMTTGNGMVPNLILRPAGTGTYLDTLQSGFGDILEQQRMRMPWYTVSGLITIESAN